MSVYQFYIPPKEISFRLKNYLSKKVLYSKKGDFGHYDGGINDDQYWQLIPGTGEYEGYYMVKSKNTSECLFSRTKKTPNVDTTSGNGKWRDNWFKLEPGTGDRANYFRLRNLDSNTVVFSRTEKKPYVGNFGADGDKFDDQYWSFEFEDMEFVSIDYRIDQQKALSSKPVSIAHKTLVNENGEKDLTMVVVLAKNMTMTSIHEYTNGISVKGTYSFSSLASIIGTSLEIGASKEWKVGEHTTTTTVFEDRPELTAAPGYVTTGEIVSTQKELEIPYTMVLKSKSTGYEVKSSGTYKGVTYWDTKTTMYTKLLSEDRSLDEGEGEGEAQVIGRPTVTAFTSGDADADDQEERSLEDGAETQNGDCAQAEENPEANGYAQDEATSEENSYAQDEEVPETNGSSQGEETAENDYAQEETADNSYAQDEEVAETNEYAQGEETIENDYAEGETAENSYAQEEEAPQESYAQEDQTNEYTEDVEESQEYQTNNYTQAEETPESNEYPSEESAPQDEEYVQDEPAPGNEEPAQEESVYAQNDEYAPPEEQGASYDETAQDTQDGQYAQDGREGGWDAPRYRY